MSLQDILKKIALSSQAEIEKIEAETAQRKGELDKASEAKAKEQKAELEAKTQAALKAVDDKTASMARRENAQLLLKTKRKMLDKAMTQLLQSLEQADDTLYEDITKKLIAKLPFTKGTMYVPEARVTLMKSLAKGFEVQAHKSLKGGFIASDAGAEVDNSFENLVFSEYASELEMFLSDQLKLV